MSQKEFVIRSLNLTNGENLTLEKAEDRVEFEALMGAGLAGDSSTFEVADADCLIECEFGGGPDCNPMPTPEVPEPPAPTPGAVPKLG